MVIGAVPSTKREDSDVSSQSRDGDTTISGDTELARAVDDFRSRLSQYDWSGQSASRRQILEAFLALALQRGFNSVSMRMMAQELGIKAPSLYAHFPRGRDEIVAESLRWHFYKFGTAILNDVASCTSADETWTTMVRTQLTLQLQLPENNLWDLLIATDRMVHVLPTDVSAEADELVELYERMFRGAAHDMGFNEPEEAVRVVMTLLEGASKWCRPGDNFEDLALMVGRADALSRSVLALADRWPAPQASAR